MELISGLEYKTELDDNLLTSVAVTMLTKYY
jgi:hypothetical protein